MSEILTDFQNSNEKALLKSFQWSNWGIYYFHFFYLFLARRNFNLLFFRVAAQLKFCI